MRDCIRATIWRLYGQIKPFSARELLIKTSLNKVV